MFFSDETADTANTSDISTPSSENGEANTTPSAKPRILIGSQRNPDAYRPSSQPSPPQTDENGAPLKTGQVVFDSEIEKSRPPRERNDEKPRRENRKNTPSGESHSQNHKKRREENDDEDGVVSLKEIENKSLSPKTLHSPVHVPVPTIRGDLSDDLQEEFEELFGNQELDTMLGDIDQVASQTLIETDTKQTGKVASIGKDTVFVDLGGREQGAVPLKQFKENPQIGDSLEVMVVRFLAEEGLYELSLPLAASDVSDWSQVEQGMIVEAKITGHNAGGLECEVNKLRAFIPMSQISIVRVEDAQPFVGQKLPCVVTECDPYRRNLVLSHRALLEKENEENRQKLLAELEIGQIREGLVRKLIDTGAFVDLGGVDGFLPVSALIWGRVRHPSDVISEGQRIRVRITNIDTVKNRISLSYRDEASDPWLNIEKTFPENTPAHGKVTRITDFGAFVELLPGVEGLIHISELSDKRVNRVSDVVKEGDSVEVLVMYMDKATKRMALSIRQLAMLREAQQSDPETENVEKTPAEPEISQPSKLIKIKKPHKGPLKGGLG